MIEQRFGRIFRPWAVAICALLMAQAPYMLMAQAPVDTGQPVPVMSPDQLGTLVAPIALYPDPLLSQVLVASTYPLEVVEANQWLLRNASLTGAALTQAAAQQNWDPSVQALVVFPDVLKRLNEDINWTTNLGNAFLAQQTDVMAAVQTMRQSAEQSGKLKSTPQEVVQNTTDNGLPEVVIMPANPDVIYVPTYDPSWYWGPPVYYMYPRWFYPPRPVMGFGFVFGPGIYMTGFFGVGWGGWGGWGWHPGWGGRTIIVNNMFIHRYNFNGGHLAGGGTSVWAHDPAHRQGVPYPNRALSAQFRATDRQNLRPSGTVAARPAAPADRMGNRPVAPNNPSANHSAFGSMENRSNSNAHTDHGYSSLGPSRSAPASRPSAPARSAPRGRP
jgi:hypothetical protein